MWLEFEGLAGLFVPEILYSNSNIDVLELAIVSNRDYFYCDQIKCYNKIRGGTTTKSYENRLILYCAKSKKGYVLLFQSPKDLHDGKGSRRTYDGIIKTISHFNFKTVFDWLDTDNNINMLDNTLREFERNDCLYLDEYRRWLNDSLNMLRPQFDENKGEIK